MVEAVMEGIALTGLDGTVTEANEEAVQMFGCRSQDELLGKNALDLIAQRDCKRAAADMQEVRKQGGVTYIDCSLVKADGSEYPGEIRASMKRDASGNPVGLIEVIRDVTERKQAEEELRKHRKHLEELVEERTAELRRANQRLQREITQRKRAESEVSVVYNALLSSVNGVIMTDLEGSIWYANPAFFRMFEYEDANELIGRYASELFTSEEVRTFADVKALIDREKGVTEEFFARRKDGTRINVEVSSSVVTDKDGNEVGRMASFVDITERRQAEQALRRSEKQASAAIEAARALTFDYDIATGKINWGGAIEAITGHTPEEFAQVDIQGWAERIHPDDRDEILAILQEAMGRDRATAEYRFKTKKGYVTLASVSITQKQDGKPVRLVGILQDITERKLMQERLIISERLAMLGQFSGSISHELRNSLATIGSSAYYLGTKLKEADEKVQEHLKRIKSSVDNATTTIQSLLDLTRMKEPRLARLDLRTITSETIAATKVPAGVRVMRDFPEQEVGVSADPEQLFMAFKNIVANAVEAMEGQGTLTVTVCSGAAGWAEVSFADSGPGIPPEYLDRVFEPLFSTKAKGIGFGLSIAKLVIDRHGGTIEAGSEPGKGAILTIRLPLGINKGKEG